MTWQRKPVAAAIAEILSAMDPTASVFATPPETVNPPAYVCGYPRTVDYDVQTFGRDQAFFQLVAYAGPFDPDALDAMLTAAKVALRANDTLQGVVSWSHVQAQTNWRRLNVAGIELLAADLTLEIRM